jgi:hypothetical protein
LQVQRFGALTMGAQVRPNVNIRDLLPAKISASLWDEVAARSSFAFAYSPPAAFSCEPWFGHILFAHSPPGAFSCEPWFEPIAVAYLPPGAFVCQAPLVDVSAALLNDPKQLLHVRPISNVCLTAAVKSETAEAASDPLPLGHVCLD